MLRDIISATVATIPRDTSVREIGRQMEEQNIGTVVVTENQKPIGIITDRDIVLRCINNGRDIDRCIAADIMSDPIVTVRDTDGIYDCIRLMKEARVRRIPVVNATGSVIGIISYHDIIAILRQELTDLADIAKPETEWEFDEAV
jgi:CBS domain-containing protein